MRSFPFLLTGVVALLAGFQAFLTATVALPAGAAWIWIALNVVAWGVLITAAVRIRRARRTRPALA